MLESIGAALGGLAAGAGAIYVAQRRRSGRIETSEAGQLWDESRKIREELRGEVGELRERVSGLEEANDTLRAQVAQLTGDNAKLSQQVRELAAKHEECMGENAVLRTEITAMKGAM